MALLMVKFYFHLTEVEFNGLGGFGQGAAAARDIREASGKDGVENRGVSMDMIINWANSLFIFNRAI